MSEKQDKAPQLRVYEVETGGDARVRVTLEAWVDDSVPAPLEVPVWLRVDCSDELARKALARVNVDAPGALLLPGKPFIFYGERAVEEVGA
jgi:hypothetical protein